MKKGFKEINWGITLNLEIIFTGSDRKDIFQQHCEIVVCYSAY